MVSSSLRPAFMRVCAVALALTGLVTSPGAAQAAEPDAHRIGNVAAWGDRDPDNDYDDAGGSGVGDNFYDQQDIPADLANLDITAVSAGEFNSMALDSAGHVHVWGYPGMVDNGFGTAPPASLADKRVTAIDAGRGFLMAVTDDGAVRVWGNWSAANPAGLSGHHVTAIAAGFGQALAVTDENGGKVYAWGSNVYGESTVPAAAQSGVVDVAADFYSSAAVKADGTLVAWGSSSIHCADDNSCSASTTPVPSPDPGRRFVDVALNYYTRGIALDDAGKVYSWGYWATPVPAELTGQKVVSVAGGGQMFAAVTDAGKVFAWGWDGYPYDHNPNCAQQRGCPPAATNVYAADNTAYVPASLASSVVTQVDLGTGHAVARIRPDLAAGTVPTISGAARVGGTLTAKPGTTSPAATGVTYRWLRNGVDTGKSGATYKPVSADVGKKLSVRVTSTKDDYGSLTRTSASTAKVVVAPSTTTITAKTVKPQKVTLTVKVKAPGVAATSLDGACTVRRGTKSSSLKSLSTRCSVKDGKATVTLTKQPKAKQYYTVRFAGRTNVATASTSRTVSATVK